MTFCEMLILGLLSAVCALLAIACIIDIAVRIFRLVKPPRDQNISVPPPPLKEARRSRDAASLEDEELTSLPYTADP
jgi:hypothetical protein